jgi:ubiquinone/menaquinone biosynthesis C-methylase UbiE
MKIFKKIYFKKSFNNTKKIGDVKNTIKLFKKNKNKNLYFLIKKRFEWMNKFIVHGDKGLEVGAGAGFSKIFTKNKSILISDFSNDTHLDIKNLDAQNTRLKGKSFDYIIAANMIHHLPYPMKFFREINRILKKNGKLIIFEPNCSILLQIIILIIKETNLIQMTVVEIILQTEVLILPTMDLLVLTMRVFSKKKFQVGGKNSFTQKVFLFCSFNILLFS